MEPKDINLENEIEEAAGGEEEIKSGLKIRTNLKAGAITLASRVNPSAPGNTVGGALIGNQLELNGIAQIGAIANVVGK